MKSLAAGGLALGAAWALDRRGPEPNEVFVDDWVEPIWATTVIALGVTGIGLVGVGLGAVLRGRSATGK